MLGDGSTETLENEIINIDTGNYYSTTKGDFTKAKVEYYNITPTSKYRIMYLMKGDGLVYIFKEIKFSYYDMTSYNIPYIPNTFMLNAVKDRFGHQDTIEYVSGNPGRPWILNCPCASFEYVEGMGSYQPIVINSFVSEISFVLNTDEFDINQNGNHRPKLSSIIEKPSYKTMSFLYSSYSRTGTHLYNSGSTERNMSIVPYLYRLQQVNNFNDGIKRYSYKGPDLSLNYIIGENEAGAHSNPVYYFGQGRDMFFSNMIDTVSEIENTTRNKYTVYNYIYDSHSREDVWAHPIDENDEYSTVKTVVSSNNENLNNTPSSLQNTKIYRNYKTKKIITGEVESYSGTLRLVEDKYNQIGEEFYYKTISYEYFKGAFNEVFNGSFMDSLRIESDKCEDNNYVNRTWSYEYSGGYDGKHPLTMKSETDPLAQKTTIYYSNFENNGLPVFYKGTYRLQNQVYDTVKFYLINMPDSIIISKDSERLQKKEITYYNPDNVTGGNIVSGYPGEIYEEKDLNPITNDLIRKTTYVYYNRDTTGMHLYQNTSYFINPNEGNLKAVIDPNGITTRYYYDIISGSEGDQDFGDNQGGSVSSGRLSYNVLYDNGTNIVRTDSWSDPRLPSRIDNYVDGERYLTRYQMYSAIGSPLMIVNENKYYSQLNYDDKFRLTCLTLPYDFSDEQPEITYDTIVSRVPVEFTSTSTGYGYLEESQQYFRFVADVPLGTGLQYSLVLDNNLPDYVSGTKQNDLIQFNKYDVGRTLYGIDSAFFVFYPPYVISKLNNTPVDYNLIIYPLDTLYTPTVSGGYGPTYYSKGFGAAFCGNLNHRDSTNCWGGTDPNILLYQYLSYKRSLNITNLLRSNLDTNVHGIVLEGLQLSASWPENLLGNLFIEIPRINGHVNCVDNDLETKWKNNVRPYLHIYGYKYAYDIRKHIKYKNGTLIYEYDDKKNTTTINSKIDKPGANNRFKTTDYYFDSFGRLKQTKIHLPNDSAFYKTEYNYLGHKAKSTDALNHSTKFSYNKYGGLSETENADQTENLVSNTYQSNILTTFYYVSNGYFNKQVYTDETGRHFEKYFDAVGNLIREVKYILYDNSTPDNPPDMDSSAYAPDNETVIPLYTDYCYDALNRVTQVKTPANKRIYCSYDALGRQSSRTTPDDGLTKYIYDKNNNLLFSQDANQRTRGSNIYTFRNYDGLNRLLSLGETQIGSPNPVFESLDTSEADFVGNNNEMLTVNVYDSLAYGSVSIFNNVPTDYHATGLRNNTKGALVATAYKTNLSDSWSYKFYRYDARGRVTKMWQYISGLGWKTMLYSYNSQDQVTYLNYCPSTAENKLYKYSYDNTARLVDVSIYTGIASEEMEEDYPGEYFSYASYAYNKNSQILEYKINNNSFGFEYEYNNRNWVTKFTRNYPINAPNLYVYILQYLSNGNIRRSIHGGDYRSLLPNNSNLNITYIYDKANRLRKANFDSASVSNTFDISMSYDNDGNIISLNRYGSNENIIDNLTYSYYVNTNKINMVSGQDPQYTYDAVGNMTSDTRDLDDVKQDLKYDHRNLLTEMRVVKKTGGGDGYETYQLMFNYDEAGNRVRKRVYFYQGEDPMPVFEEDDMTGSWDLVGDEYYVRDVSGKEIAVYHSYDLDHWNVWGTDNVGKINANGNKFFYIKDHLGSVRVVLNSSNQIVAANDYDCWGYPLENRSYQSDDIDYKFTGKQRDAETGYDYFGARYYDARIANWGSVDPLFEKHIGWNPYNYVLRNPIALIDPDGMQVSIQGYTKETQTLIMNDLKTLSGYTFKNDNGNLRIDHDYARVREGTSGYAAFIAEMIDCYNGPLIGGRDEAHKSVEKSSNFDENNNGIYLNTTQIKALISGVMNLDSRTLGYGMTFLHELLHSKFFMDGAFSGADNELPFNDPGKIEKIDPENISLMGLNLIRRQMGPSWGQRLSHGAKTIDGSRYSPFDQGSMDKLNRFQPAKPADDQQYIKY